MGIQSGDGSSETEPDKSGISGRREEVRGGVWMKLGGLGPRALNQYELLASNSDAQVQLIV